MWSYMVTGRLRLCVDIELFRGTTTVVGVSVLRFDELLLVRPQRVLVAGSSGAGKTTTAGRIATILGGEHTEIDGFFHGPGWTRRETFEADVAAFSAEPTWVTEWQYGSVQALLAERADTLVWLHFRRPTVLRRVVRRTVSRRLKREPLWNNNVEPPFRTFFTDPDHIVRWAWRTHEERATQVKQLLRELPELQVVELRSPRELEAWLAGPLASA
jgi:adenylate kinase family enzyme